MSTEQKEQGEAQLPAKAEVIPVAPQMPLGIDPRILAKQVGLELEARATILRALLSPKLLGPNAFINYNNKPYLPGAECQRVAGPGGICLEVDRHPTTGEYAYKRLDGQDAEGNYFEISISGKAYFVATPRRAVPETGTSSTRDGFYKRKGADRESRRQPIEAMSEGDVRKKALMNLWARAVQGLLGIKGMTWAELEELGYSRSAARQVKFKGGAPGQAQPTERPHEEGEDDATIKKKLSGMILTIVGWKKGDPITETLQALASGELELLSRFKDKKTGEDVSITSTDDKRLRGKWLRAIYGKAKRRLEEFQSQAANAPEDQPELWNLPPEFEG